jgi:hypothetical protein
MSLPIRPIEIIWLLLMLITIGNALIAEKVEPSMLVVIAVALSLAFKGWMVVEHFMELKNANPKIRAWMNAYFFVIPLMIIVVHAYPEWVASITTLR